MINWFCHMYPYGNLHELNLDWAINTVKRGEKEIADFIGVNTIKYANPILWNITSQYEANTVVVDGQTGNAYISVKPVPNGVHLNRTEYWTQIYNYANVVDTLMEQIAHNEGESTTATKSYNVGELVFFSCELYRVISPMIAGDSFVVNSNVVKTTIENELNRNKSDINAEASARADADTQLQSNINAEAVARADADTQLQSNINAEATVRADADTQLQSNINAEATARADADSELSIEISKISHIIYTSNYDTIDEVIEVLGTDGVLCLNSEVNISNKTIVINNKIISTPNGKFTGTPTSLTINNQDILPMWFGVQKANSSFNNAPAIQNAINACPVGGRVYLEKGEYYVSTGITINKVITFSGDRDGTYITAGISDLSTIITISGVGSTYVDGATIENMNIGRYKSVDDSTALFITRCANTLIRNIRFINCNYGAKYKFTTSTRTEGCISISALQQSKFFGYLLDCTENAPLSGTSANGSCYFINCSVNVSVQPTGDCEGFYAGGVDIRDLYFIQCETALTNNGINLDATSNAMATDINITNCVLDRCNNHGIRIKNIPALNGGVKISNTFITLNPDSANPEQGVFLDTCWNVYANNLEVYCNGTNATGLYLKGCHGCVINNTLFNACGVAFVSDTSSLNTYSNIVARAQSTQPTGIICSDSRSVLNNLTFSLYTLGLSLTGNNNIVLGIIRSTNVTTPYSDTGTDNQIEYIN